MHFYQYNEIFPLSAILLQPQMLLQEDRRTLEQHQGISQRPIAAGGEN